MKCKLRTIHKVLKIGRVKVANANVEADPHVSALVHTFSFLFCNFRSFFAIIAFAISDPGITSPSDDISTTPKVN